MGLKEKFKKKVIESPREIAKKITDEIKEPHHIGKHTIETVGQELFSLANERPMFRDSDWRKRARNIRAICMNKISQGDPHFQNSLIQLNLIEDMR